MSKTRADLRGLVRAQLDMDDEELPSTTLDPWLDDAYDQTLTLSDRWPFFEDAWTFTTVASQIAYPLASLAAAHANSYAIQTIGSVMDTTTAGGEKFVKNISHDFAEQAFGLGGLGQAVPAYFSRWSTDLYLWPSPFGSRTIKVRGYRKGAWGAADADVVDADDRLHVPLSYYAIAMAYGQQEDEILKADWMGQWGSAVRRAHDAILAEPQSRPLVLGGGGL